MDDGRVKRGRAARDDGRVNADQPHANADHPVAARSTGRSWEEGGTRVLMLPSINGSHLHTATFFMYDQPELDHGWIKTCDGFAELAHSVASEKLAEVGLHSQLIHHPLRVRNPAKAAIFYLPIFEATSYLLGEQPPARRLRNCTVAGKAVPSALLRSHHSRMAAAAAVLAVSPHWQRCRGCDHVFLSSFTDSPGAALSTRLCAPPASLRP